MVQSDGAWIANNDGHASTGWTYLEEGDYQILLPKGFSVGSPALCTYYGESQSVVGKHNLEIMNDNW